MSVIKSGMNPLTLSKVIIMQSLKNLTRIMFQKKPMLRFLSIRKHIIISIEYTQKTKTVEYSWASWYNQQSQIYNNRFCSFKLFVTAVTLKYGQGQWIWFEWVKCNEKYDHVKFDIYHIYSFWENCNNEVFQSDINSCTESWKNYLTLIIQDSHC